MKSKFNNLNFSKELTTRHNLSTYASFRLNIFIVGYDSHCHSFIVGYDCHVVNLVSDHVVSLKIILTW